MSTEEEDRAKAVDILENHYKGSQNSKDVFNYLWDSGLIDKGKLKKAIVRREIDQRSKGGAESYREIRAGICVDLNVSETFVDNCRYKYSGVNL